MIVTVFRSRLREEHLTEYLDVAAHIDALAHTMPGFVAIKTFVADDGERVSVVEFETMEQQRAWLEHPEHREAQRLGRERFYSAYRIDVCERLRGHGWGREQG
ncbi:MAG: antibiotic biosynthesis monooxygenase [Sandaracinaceae bacterium]